MCSMMAISHEGHLRTGFQSLQFLNSTHNGDALFDFSEPDIDHTQFITEDWSTAPCSLFKEDTNFNAPTLRGIDFTMKSFW